MEDLKITLLSKDKARLEKVGEFYWIYYNPLTYKSNSTVQLLIEGQFTNPRLKIGCMSCTKGSLVNSTVELTYDTTIIGNFEKSATFYYTQDGQEKSKIIKLTGTVIRN